MLSTEGVIWCIINGIVDHFIGHCLIHLDPWKIYTYCKVTCESTNIYVYQNNKNLVCEKFSPNKSYFNLIMDTQSTRNSAKYEETRMTTSIKAKH